MDKDGDPLGPKLTVYQEQREKGSSRDQNLKKTRIQVVTAPLGFECFLFLFTFDKLKRSRCILICSEYFRLVLCFFFSPFLKMYALVERIF